MNMSPRARAVAAWSITALCALLLATLVLVARHEGTPGVVGLVEDAALVLVFLAFPTVGALIVSRHGGHAVGWILLAIGLTFALGVLSDEWALSSAPSGPEVLPGAKLMAWLTTWLWLPTVTMTGTYLLLLFPDGQIGSRRCHAVARLGTLGLVLGCLGWAFAPGPLAEPFGFYANPFGLEAVGGLMHVAAIGGTVAVFASILASVGCLLTRFRRARGVARQQLKLLLYAAAVFALTVLVGFASGYYQLTGVGLATIPVAVGVAIFRYRLYDIDLIINRTLVYGSLTAILGLAYATSVFAVNWVLNPFHATDLSVAASTLLVAALFRPVRARVQAFIDRRFYRSRYDATRTLEGFSTRLRHEVDLEALTADLVKVVDDTMQPTHVSLWLRAPSPTLR